jgi:MFS family permease
VPTELSEDDSRAYGVVQAFSLLLAGGALYAAYLMTRQAAPVFLGQVADPYDRVVWVGVGVGIPTALCGAVVAMMATQQRRWDFLRIAATTLLIGNLGIPLTWGVLWLIQHGYLHL